MTDFLIKFVILWIFFFCVSLIAQRDKYNVGFLNTSTRKIISSAIMAAMVAGLFTFLASQNLIKS